MRRLLEERPRYALACALGAAALLAVVVLIATSAGGEASRPTAGPGERVVSERHLQRLITEARAHTAESTRLRRELRSTRHLAERRRERFVAVARRQQRRSNRLRLELDRPAGSLSGGASASSRSARQANGVQAGAKTEGGPDEQRLAYRSPHARSRDAQHC